MSKQRPVEESGARPHGEAAGQGVGAAGRCCMCKGPERREKEAQPDHEGLCSSGCGVGPIPGMAGSLQVVAGELCLRQMTLAVGGSRTGGGAPGGCGRERGRG